MFGTGQRFINMGIVMKIQENKLDCNLALFTVKCLVVKFILRCELAKKVNDEKF